MPAVADYIIIKDAQFPANGNAYSFAMAPVADGTKSILMFRMYLRFKTSALWEQDLIVRINGTEVLKLRVHPLLIGTSTIHEVISENPLEIYKRRGNTISFSAVPYPSYSGDPPPPVVMVSDVALWFQTSVGE